ncbi:MAG: hypothetical protein RJB66_634 [Pseudomonadota bacterium]|jgi:hypothetical protein
MRFIVNLSVIFFSAILTVQAKAEGISSLKAAEVACHRIERLVVLKKIDKGFVSKFQKMDLELLTAGDPTGAKFAVTSFQNAPADGSPLSVTLFVEGSGKVLNYLVNQGGTAGPNVEWTGKDPVSLVESAMHFVLDEHESNHQLHPFAMDFESLTIEKKTQGGKALAELLMRAKTTTNKLVLTLDLNGKILKNEIVP